MTTARVPASTTPGELQFVPDVPHQCREVWVKIEQLQGGILRFTLPAAGNRQWATRNRMDLARIIAELFRERQVAAVAAWRNTVYDAHPATPQHKRSKPASRGKKRCDVYDVGAWLEDVTGLWISPKGHRHQPDSWVVRRVRAERKRQGLPEFPSLADGRRRRETVPGTQLGLDLDALIEATRREAS